MNTIIATFAAVILCAVQGAAGPQATGNDGPPSLGKWAFQGKDATGLAWAGTLSIEKLDPARFNSKEHFALCSLEVESTDETKGIRGVEAPCTYDPKTRELSFEAGFSKVSVYKAVLSPDGKSLTRGTWTETKESTIVSRGEWTATLPGQ